MWIDLGADDRASSVYGGFRYDCRARFDDGVHNGRDGRRNRELDRFFDDVVCGNAPFSDIASGHAPLGDVASGDASLGDVASGNAPLGDVASGFHHFVLSTDKRWEMLCAR